MSTQREQITIKMDVEISYYGTRVMVPATFTVVWHDDETFEREVANLKESIGQAVVAKVRQMKGYIE